VVVVVVVRGRKSVVAKSFGALQIDKAAKHLPHDHGHHGLSSGNERPRIGRRVQIIHYYYHSQLSVAFSKNHPRNQPTTPRNACMVFHATANARFSLTGLAMTSFIPPKLIICSFYPRLCRRSRKSLPSMLSVYAQSVPFS